MFTPTSADIKVNFLQNTVFLQLTRSVPKLQQAYSDISRLGQCVAACNRTTLTPSLQNLNQSQDFLGSQALGMVLQ